MENCQIEMEQVRTAVANYFAEATLDYYQSRPILLYEFKAQMMGALESTCNYLLKKREIKEDTVDDTLEELSKKFDQKYTPEGIAAEVKNIWMQHPENYERLIDEARQMMTSPKRGSSYLDQLIQGYSKLSSHSERRENIIQRIFENAQKSGLETALSPENISDTVREEFPTQEEYIEYFNDLDGGAYSLAKAKIGVRVIGQDLSPQVVEFFKEIEKTHIDVWTGIYCNIVKSVDVPMICVPE